MNTHTLDNTHGWYTPDHHWITCDSAAKLHQVLFQHDPQLLRLARNVAADVWLHDLYQQQYICVASYNGVTRFEHGVTRVPSQQFMLRHTQHLSHQSAPQQVLATLYTGDMHLNQRARWFPVGVCVTCMDQTP
jgi:hypothetical protein